MNRFAQQARIPLRLDSVTKSVGKVIALAGMSFKVQERACFGLLGPNGAGKSALIRWRILNFRRVPSWIGNPPRVSDPLKTSSNYSRTLTRRPRAMLPYLHS
jgi:ABC-type glutathione transport system ATPase component